MTTPVKTPSVGTQPTPEKAKAAEVKATPEELKKAFDSLPVEFKEAIAKINKDIQEHNKKVDSIKAAEATDPLLIKAEIFEQNPSNNKNVATLLAEYRKLEEQMENVRKDAYKVIDTDGLMPASVTPEKLTALKTDVTESTKELREVSSAFAKMEDAMPMFKGKLVKHFEEIKTRRGVAKQTSSSKGESGTKRPRFKKLTVNGVTQDDKGNTVWQKVDDEERYTFTFLSQYLKKQHAGITWGANDFTAAYMEGQDPDNLPETSEFTMTHTFTTKAGNAETVDYVIKTYR